MNNTSIAGIILAAGAASRMGQPKLLLPWNGEALICHAVRVALRVGLDPLVVVTGARAEEIQQAIGGFPVTLVHNPDWQSGQSTSVRVGILSLPEPVEAAFFLLGDQPFVSPDLIQSMIKTYRETHPAILAPFIGDKRANPVLFSRAMFESLAQLQGDVGARSIFRQYPPEPMQWGDERILFDIDTLDDYQKLLELSKSKFDEQGTVT